MIPDITAVGSVALDTVTTNFGTRKECLGGSATYFSISASFQACVGLIGVVGEDFPNEHVELLKSHKVGLEGLEIVKGKETFRWSGSYLNDLNAADTHCTLLNVFANFSPKLSQDYKKAKCLFLASIQPELQMHVMDEMDPGFYSACDTIHFYIDNCPKELGKVMDRVNVVFINDGEARKFTGCTNNVRAGRKIMEDHNPDYLFLKKGEHGCLIFGRNGFIKAITAYPLEEVVDPTGAGDSFAGGVMGFIAREGRLNDSNVTEAARYGTAMSSFLVTDFSTAAFERIDRKMIEERVEALRFLGD